MSSRYGLLIRVTSLMTLKKRSSQMLPIQENLPFSRIISYTIYVLDVIFRPSYHKADQGIITMASHWRIIRVIGYRAERSIRTEDSSLRIYSVRGRHFIVRPCLTKPQEPQCRVPCGSLSVGNHGLWYIEYYVILRTLLHSSEWYINPASTNFHRIEHFAPLPFSTLSLASWVI